MEEKPKLESAVFEFSQEANCTDMEREIETIEIKCESSLGISRDKGCFFVLKTDSWSVNNAEDLKELFDKIEIGLKEFYDKKD
jgi:hypothetical protein